MAEEGERRGNGSRMGSIPELAIVFGLTVAVPVSLSIAPEQPENFDFSQERLLSTIAVEALAVAVLWPWLARRGWALRTIAGAPAPMDVVRGIGVFVLACLAFYVSAITWMVVVPRTQAAMMAATATGTAAPWAIVLVSIVNPVVEEFLWLTYGVTAMSRYGLRLAVFASIVLRVAVHSYQGILALTSILPLAIVFTVYYARTRRVWPVVVAHMFLDTISLSPLGQ